MSKRRKPAFPNRMRAARLERGLTIEEVATLAELSYSFIQRAESCTRGVGAENMRKIARALRKHPGELFFDYVGPPDAGSDSPASQAASLADKMDPETMDTWLTIGRSLLSRRPHPSLGRRRSR